MTIHVFTHVHWDREWFLPEQYINEWLDDLFGRLFVLIEQVPDYCYILDGETLILEDYLSRYPDRLETIQRYSGTGNLLVGPGYVQLDWRVVSEESLIRNLFFGINDAKSYGNLMSQGWIVDSFGHCSQSPQIHSIFGIRDVFVWRGPVFRNDHIQTEFIWQGSDGTQVTAHYLVSGYRNFYNLTDTTEYVNLRIEKLKNVLERFSPHGNIIFLDGYDNDIHPEDPFAFIKNKTGFVRSTPGQYAKLAGTLQKCVDMPTIRGELCSGKYASVFPGTLSSRIYLKVENDLVETTLAYFLEPLQSVLHQSGITVSVTTMERLWRDLLKTQLHDCIGGVCVDQVHDNMESTYRRIYAESTKGICDTLGYIPTLLNLQQGTYVFLPSPFKYKSLWLNGKDTQYLVSSQGLGFYKVEKTEVVTGSSREVDSYCWQNDYYRLQISRDGIIFNGKKAGELLLEKDNGDTYTADPEFFEAAPAAKTMQIKLLSDNGHFAKVLLKRRLIHGQIVIETEEELFMSNTPLLEWTVNIDSSGSEFRLRFRYQTADTESSVFAKMPFDICQRPRLDENIFGTEIPKILFPVITSARETDRLSDFPFHGFVALGGADRTVAILAKGLREYEVDSHGTILLTLRRSVQFLAKSDLKTRVGDAGPYMYVPGAKDERKTQLKIALVDMRAHVRSPKFLKWYYLFEYGFLVFENKEYEGRRSSARIWHESLPWSGFQNNHDGNSFVRVYNPYLKFYKFSNIKESTDPFGRTNGRIGGVPVNRIEHIMFRSQLCRKAKEVFNPTAVELLHFHEWPSGNDHSTIEKEQFLGLQKRVKMLRKEKESKKKELGNLSQPQNKLHYHRTKHSIYTLEREILEGELSLLLNREKLYNNRARFHERIRRIGRQLNEARRKRRTYDYILGLYE